MQIDEMKTFDDVVKDVESAGFFWAVEGHKAGYTAVCNRRGLYTGDDLSGPGAVRGATPAEALSNAMARELAYENERREKAARG